MADKSVMVLVDALDQAGLDQVAAEIGKNGLKIEQVLRGMRTIVGTVSDDLTLDRVRNVRGVQSIRAEGEVSLPPMDPSIPQ
jgi:ligand-binding sensor domain-containing protein